MNTDRCRRAAILLMVVATSWSIGVAHAERVKDLATVGGVRSNQLVGYGLVVGLDGTGDQTTQAPFTAQSIKNMLARFGVSAGVIKLLLGHITE